MTTKNIPINKLIVSPFQARQSIDPDGVVDLAVSIHSLGLLQPLIGRMVDGGVQIAFGARRLEALKLLARIQEGEEPMPDGWKDDPRIAALVQAMRDNSRDYTAIPVRIARMSDLEFYEAGTAENLQRHDLNDIEKAHALKVYMQTFSKTSAEAGALFGISGGAVRNYLRMLALPQEVQDQIADGKIPQVAARKLLQVQGFLDEKNLKMTAGMIAAGDVRSADVDSVIQEAVKRAPNVKVMWEAWQKGEPRGGRGLWPLDSFTLDLPKPITVDWFRRKFKQTVQTLETALGKDNVDPWIEGQIANCTGGVPLADAARWLESTSAPEMLQDVLAAQEVIYTLILPPACAHCPFHTVIAGQHICGLSPCWENKREAYIVSELGRVQAHCNFPLYDEKRDGKYFERAELTTYARLDNGEWGSIETPYTQWVEQGADHLRLMEFDPQYLAFPFTNSFIYGLVSVRPEIKERHEALDRSRTQVETENRIAAPAEWDRRAQADNRRHISTRFFFSEVAPRITRIFDPIKSDIFDFIGTMILPEYLVEQIPTQGDDDDLYKIALVSIPFLYALEDASYSGPVAVVDELRALAEDFQFIKALDLDALETIARSATYEGGTSADADTMTPDLEQDDSGGWIYEDEEADDE